MSYSRVKQSAYSDPVSSKTRKTPHAHNARTRTCWPLCMGLACARVCLSVVHTAVLSEQTGTRRGAGRGEPSCCWGRQRRNLLAQTLLLPTSCSAASAAVPPFSPRQPLRESQLWFIFLFFIFKEKAPHLPRSRPRRPGGSSAPARPARSRRTGRRRAQGAGEVRVASPRGGRRPARRHRRRRRRTMTALSAGVTGWSRPPEARVRVGHLRPGLGPGGRERVGRGRARHAPGEERAPPPSAGKGRGQPRCASHPRPPRSARGWALEAQGPQTSAFPRASGWQVVGDVVASRARLHLGRSAQGRGPTYSSRFQKGPGPGLAHPLLPPTALGFIAVILFIALAGQLSLGWLLSKQNAELPKQHRFVFEPLRNWCGPPGSNLQVGPEPWAMGG